MMILKIPRCLKEIGLILKGLFWHTSAQVDKTYHCHQRIIFKTIVYVYVKPSYLVLYYP